MGQHFCYHTNSHEKTTRSREGLNLRGYYTTNGFRGLVNGKYVLFASEEDYYDSMADEE